MNYQWNPTKASANRRKPGIIFADDVAVFGDKRAISILDDYPDEERFITIGLDAFGRVLVVVYTYRDEDIRIISARKASAIEQQQYEGEQCPWSMISAGGKEAQSIRYCRAKRA
jgi:uncharacterized protein